MKLCSKCKILKPLENFSKNKTTKDGYSYWCKICRKIYRKNNPEKPNKKAIRNRHLIREYGISLENYNKMFEEQKGCCFICRIHQSKLEMSLVVDHDHKTNKIRGLLCRNCNCRLGHYESGNIWYKENENILKEYLKRGKNE